MYSNWVGQQVLATLITALPLTLITVPSGTLVIVEVSYRYIWYPNDSRGELKVPSNNLVIAVVS